MSKAKNNKKADRSGLTPEEAAAFEAMDSAGVRIQEALDLAEGIVGAYELRIETIWPVVERILDTAEEELEAARVDAQISRYSQEAIDAAQESVDPVLQAFLGGAA